MEYAVFAVDDRYQPLLNQLFKTVQATPLWSTVKGSCFTMAGFLALALQEQGHSVELLACTGMAIEEQRAMFRLGFKGLTVKESEFDGHVACLVDQKIWVDFGLTNVHRHGFIDFPIALAMTLPEPLRYPLAMQVNPRYVFVWDTAEANDGVLDQVHRHHPLAQQLYQQYLKLRTT